jgi:hypothetical protein
MVVLVLKILDTVRYGKTITDKKCEKRQICFEDIVGKMRLFSRKNSTLVAIWYRLCKESGRK